MYITDPRNGDSVFVNENKIQAICEARQFPVHVNDNGFVYKLVVDQAIAGAAHFAYILNSDDKPLRITKIEGFVSADTEIYILGKVTGAATTPSELTPVNQNLGSGETADGTFSQGAALALTGGTEMDRWTVDFSQNPNFCKVFENEIIIPKNQTLVLAGTAAATINCTIDFYMHEKLA